MSTLARVPPLLQAGEQTDPASMRAEDSPGPDVLERRPSSAGLDGIPRPG